MLKNKLDYKLVNLVLIALIVFLIYKTGNLWMGVVGKAFQIITPFLFAFALAYAVHPFLKKMQAKKVPKWLGITIIVAIILALVAFIIYIITTVMIGQISSLFTSIISFIKNIQTRDFNLSGLETTLVDTFKTVITDISKYVSNGAINILDSSIGVLSKMLIIFASFIYFLIDMDKIRKEVKFFFQKRTDKAYNYVRSLDKEMKNYLSGLVQVILITLVEYTLAYTIIGHPNAILLGFLAAIANLIPYFGGIAVNIIASITAFVISPALLIRTIITFIVLSSLDSYVINPTVYGKTNRIHPLVTIIALFAGGVIFGITGVFISFPLTIIIATTYKYFKDDIARNFKKQKKEEE